MSDGSEQQAKKADRDLPAIDFATFVLSLNHSALVHLGLAPDPVTGQRAQSLPLAKQTIDLLGMLHEKTRGNLTGDEERALSNVLYELRLSYVQAVKSA
ncbi:MAG TPA: DUF1844 domain-containing protein [Polyangiaceae bacterium]|nr:DUF1844 domain-containing protein [Polyangiaceae bacterium]